MLAVVLKIKVFWFLPPDIALVIALYFKGLSTHVLRDIRSEGSASIPVAARVAVECEVRLFVRAGWIEGRC